MKYKVLYASVGVLSGHQPGDVVDVADDNDAAHLIALGLIKPVKEPAKSEPAKPATPASQKPAAKPETQQPAVKPAGKSAPVIEGAASATGDNAGGK